MWNAGTVYGLVTHVNVDVFNISFATIDETSGDITVVTTWQNSFLFYVIGGIITTVRKMLFLNDCPGL